MDQPYTRGEYVMLSGDPRKTVHHGLHVATWIVVPALGVSFLSSLNRLNEAA